MGREIRKVPANWEHPNDERGRPQPMYDRTFAEAVAKWKERFAAHKPEEHNGYEYWVVSQFEFQPRQRGI